MNFDGMNATQLHDAVARREKKKGSSEFLVEVAPGAVNYQRLKGMWPLLRKLGLSPGRSVQGNELYVDKGVPRVKEHRALVLTGTQFKVGRKPVVAVSVRGNWHRMLGVKEEGNNPAQFNGRRCDCGKVGRAALSNATVLCRSCVGVTLDRRLTAAIKVAGLMRDYRGWRSADIHTELILYCAHIELQAHNFWSSNDATESEADIKPTWRQVDSLCEAILDGSMSIDAQTLQAVTAKLPAITEYCKRNRKKHRYAREFELAYEALEEMHSSYRAEELVLLYMQFTNDEVLRGFSVETADTGFLAEVGERLDIEVWVAEAKSLSTNKSLLSMVTTEGHLLSWTTTKDVDHFHCDERYLVSASVTGHASDAGHSVTELSHVTWIKPLDETD
jgi:hypothetical protein